MTVARLGCVTNGPSTAMEVRRATVQYPGGLRARYRWTGTGGAAAIFEGSEAGGDLRDHGTLAGPEPDRLCRAELRVEGPLGAWTARFASRIFDEPQGSFWDTPGLLLVKYGFRAYALVARTGELRWSHGTATPLVALLASSLLHHVICQSEVETVALDEHGETVWRVAHSDVVTAAELVAGTLVLTSFTGQIQALDPTTGRAHS